MHAEQLIRIVLLLHFHQLWNAIAIPPFCAFVSSRIVGVRRQSAIAIGVCESFSCTRPELIYGVIETSVLIEAFEVPASFLLVKRSLQVST
jgi:hypothetical protein